ncbi:class I SAM-dependent methyltransferase [Shewanella sp. AS1]|uniref:class I SAM-dependent methyltransferase n=1 Tax=Shewanella sp. AS1 TaxID=2907626 RepID=UPI001F19CB94|nr:class I SAM-dependent methyltransferase [Shewanella sp. AS1]MCE9678271.1 class I SAM-dependent methyltransferase [Shewanella sp. AS1]
MEQWTNYWQHTRALNSFSEGESALGYHGELRDYWHNKIAGLPKNANVLDVGTGNGALAVLCFQYSAIHQYSWEISAIDAADIRPQQNQYSDESINSALKSISFFGNTQIEKTHFDPQSFDLICSQFALEYSDLSQSLIECIRLLKPKGRLVAMLHYEHSNIAAHSRSEKRALDLFFNEADFLARVQEILDLVSQCMSQRENIQTNDDFKSLNSLLLQKVRDLGELAKDGHCEAAFNEILSQIAPLLYELRIENRAIFKKYVKQLNFHRMRLEDQLNAVVDSARKQSIEAILGTLGVECSFSEIVIDKECFGIVLEVNNR